MRVHVLQHVPFEGLGSMTGSLDRCGVQTSYTRFFQRAQLPDIDGLDFIIALGGSMSVNEEATLPWLRSEKQFLCAAIAKGVAVLGICLGAQLIASALGAAVYRNRHREIGWFPIERTACGKESFRFPTTCRVFHWHGETFDLPSGAIRLARSAACENQAFQLGRNVIGVQFHLETTPEGAAAIIDNCGHELIPGPYVQPEAVLRAVAPAAYAKINTIADKLLFYLTCGRLST